MSIGITGGGAGTGTGTGLTPEQTAEIENSTANNNHQVYKIASIDTYAYSNIGEVTALYMGSLTGNTAIALNAFNAIYELKTDGTILKLTDYFDGLQVIDNTDDKSKKFTIAGGWEITLSNNYLELSNLPVEEAESALFEYEENEVPVIFIFGESNADGRGSLADLPGVDATFLDKVKIWDKIVTANPATASVNRVNDGTWKDYVLGDSVTLVETPLLFGVELGIATRWRDELYEKINKPLYIVKLAVGGTSLSGANSNPDINWADTEESLRQLAVEYFALPAIREIQTLGFIPKCAGIIWGQGESDTDTVSDANAYYNNLQNFLPNFATAIGFPDARVLIMGLSNAKNTTNWNIVKQAQINYTDNNDNAVLIPTDGSDNHLPISRYVDEIVYGKIHYSSSGLFALACLYFDSFNFAGSEYNDTWDFSYFSNTKEIGEAITPQEITLFDTYGRPENVMFPTTDGSIKAAVFSRVGEIVARPTYSSLPPPMFGINALNNHTNAEIVFRLVHNGEVNTNIGISFRSIHPDIFGMSSGNWRSYLTQIQGSGSIFKAHVNTGGWTLIGNENATQSPVASEPYWYRITLIGSTLKMYNSPDGKIWTQQLVATNSEIISGNLYFSLYRGNCDYALGNLRISNFGFDVLRARNL